MSQAQEQMSVAGRIQNVDLIEEQILVARRNQNVEVADEQINVAQLTLSSELPEEQIQSMGLFGEQMPDALYVQNNELIEG